MVDIAEYERRRDSRASEPQGSSAAAGHDPYKVADQHRRAREAYPVDIAEYERRHGRASGPVRESQIAMKDRPGADQPMKYGPLRRGNVWSSGKRRWANIGMDPESERDSA